MTTPMAARRSTGLLIEVVETVIEVLGLGPVQATHPE
jgi:hypothetical protein